MFADLEEIIDGRTEVAGVPIVLDDVVTAAADYYQLDGSYTSMPWNTSSAIMFLNRTLLDAAGVEGTPTTWQELEAACATFMASDAATDSCVTWPNHSWFVEQDIALQGDCWPTTTTVAPGAPTRCSSTPRRWSTTSPGGRAWPIRASTPTPAPERDWGGTYDLFAAQNVPFLLYSSSDTTAAHQEGVTVASMSRLHSCPARRSATGGGALIGGATNWVINGLDEQTQDGAIAWVNFLSNPENAASWHARPGTSRSPKRQSRLLEADGYYDANPNQRIAGEQLGCVAEDSGHDRRAHRQLRCHPRRDHRSNRSRCS